MVSNITTFCSRKIDKDNSKSGIRKPFKQRDSCSVYMNKIVDDSVEMIKVDENEISEEEIPSKGSILIIQEI